MVIELPTDFPHQAPKGYKYEMLEFKRNVIAIWTVCNLDQVRKSMVLHDVNDATVYDQLWNCLAESDRPY